VSDESPHPQGILDTSTVILLEKLADAKTLPAEPLITAVTLAELSVGPLVAKGESERVARQTQLQQAEADFKPLPFDADAARAFGSVAASLRRAGRKTTARTYDAMIAATAVANDLPVYTCNPTDFNGIDGLDVVAVPIADDPLASSASEQTAHETAHDPENPQQPG
jgi:tRNA(fMet)-specific endonuclease VapC